MGITGAIAALLLFAFQTKTEALTTKEEIKTLITSHEAKSTHSGQEVVNGYIEKR